MKRRTFTSEQKTTIVLAALSNKRSTLELSKEYELTPQIIERWKDEFTRNAHKVFSKDSPDSEKDKTIHRQQYIITKLTTQNDFFEKVLAVMK